MATLEQQIGATERAFEELAAQGREWVELDEVARRAMVNHRQHRRYQRTRLANGIADMFLSHGSGHSGRIPFRYRHQTQLAAGELEAAGRIEHRFKDEEGRLRKDPPGRRDYRDRRYRLVPEAAEGAETSPQDRFEGLVRRIEALPAAVAEGEGDDAITVVSTELRTPKNPTWPRSTTIDLRVAYLPSRDGAAERDAQSVVASWSTPLTDGSTGLREEHLAAANLADDPDAGRVLGMLEDSVQAVELTELGGKAEEGVRQLLLRTFTEAPMDVERPVAAPVGAPTTAYDSSGPHVM